MGFNSGFKGLMSQHSVLGRAIWTKRQFFRPVFDKCLVRVAFWLLTEVWGIFLSASRKVSSNRPELLPLLFFYMCFFKLKPDRPKQCNISYWQLCIVKPTRCTIFRVYWISLYMFRTAFPSIIRSLRLYIQHHVYVVQVHWLHASGHEM